MSSKLLLFLAFAAFAQFSQATDLYAGNNHGILVLDHTNFDKTVYSQTENSSAHLVLFYSSEWETSRRYYDTFTQIADTATGWTKLVKLAAVDCGNLANSELCGIHGFTRLPVVKYIQKDSGIYMFEQKLTVLFKPEAMMEQLSDQINKDYQANKHQTWPNFEFLPDFENKTDVDEIWNQANHECNFQFLVIVVDSPTDTKGMSNFISTSLLVGGNKLPVRRITANHALAKLIDPKLLPSVTSMMVKRKLELLSPSCAVFNEGTMVYNQVLALKGILQNTYVMGSTQNGENEIFYQLPLTK